MSTLLRFMLTNVDGDTDEMIDDHTFPIEPGDTIDLWWYLTAKSISYLAEVLAIFLWNKRPRQGKLSVLLTQDDMDYLGAPYFDCLKTLRTMRNLDLLQTIECHDDAISVTYPDYVIHPDSCYA